MFVCFLNPPLLLRYAARIAPWRLDLKDERGGLDGCRLIFSRRLCSEPTSWAHILGSQASCFSSHGPSVTARFVTLDGHQVRRRGSNVRSNIAVYQEPGSRPLQGDLGVACPSSPSSLAEPALYPVGAPAPRRAQGSCLLLAWLQAPRAHPTCRPRFAIRRRMFRPRLARWNRPGLPQRPDRLSLPSPRLPPSRPPHSTH